MSPATSLANPLQIVKPAVTPANYAFPWTSDQGNGTYGNPVIYADYSDPDVIRVGNNFYLTASSFNCTPGLPILHSVDLVNWTIIGHAVKNVPHPRYAQVQPGCGIWAPAMRFHNEQFWIYFAMPDEGIYLVTAKNPAGPWSEPHLVQAGRGLIDPCPFWDEDGSAWLVHAYAGSRAGIKHRLQVCPMSPDGLSLTGPGTTVFHNPDKHPTLEGPKFLKRDGWYYISAPAGGVENGWQVILRAKNILGPYEDKIVLAQNNTGINGPHQGALVDTVDGHWWFMHFQDAGVYGRIIHLQPVAWQDGWPLMGDVAGGRAGEPVLHFQKPAGGAPVLFAAPQTSDEFTSEKLGLQWQWHANHEPGWHSLSARPGHLRLFAHLSTDLASMPHLLSQKFPAPVFAVETQLDFSALEDSEEAGLVVMGKAHAALAVRRNGVAFQLVLRVNNQDLFVEKIFSAEIRLRLRVAHGGLCEFGYATDGDFVSIPELFLARAGVWIGAKTGIYCRQINRHEPRGHADFGYFRFLSVR